MSNENDQIQDCDSGPNNWVERPLKEVGLWFSGGTPSKKRDDFWNGETPWVSPKDMKRHRLFDTIDHISDSAVKAGARILPRNSVLIVIRGMILAHSAPVAIIQREMACNQDIKAVVSSDDISPDFLAHWLSSNSDLLLGLTTESTHGTKRLPPDSLYRSTIAVPPIAEQEAIASALSDADALIESLEKLLAKKRQIKQGAMQELLTGRRRLPGFEGNWTDTVLRACLSDAPSYGINAAGVEQRGGLPAYLRITDITDDGSLSDDERVAVDHELSDNYKLTENDLVLARTGASVGKSYLYHREDGELVFAGFLIRVQVDHQKLNPLFLFNFTKTEAYWSWVTVMSMRSGQPGINGAEYGSMPLRLPPTMAEQAAIAVVLEDMDHDINAIQARLRKSRQIKQAMMQQLLTGRIRLV